MSLTKYVMPTLVVGVLLLGVGVIASRWLGTADSGTTIAIKQPALSAIATRGKNAFDTICASCHGANAAGTGKGPPLVHAIYNPGHHNDDAFYRAATSGVPQHHWPFGNMPAQPQATDENLAAIVRYVRELQEANGIFYRPHTM